MCIDFALFVVCFYFIIPYTYIHSFLSCALNVYTFNSWKYAIQTSYLHYFWLPHLLPIQSYDPWLRFYYLWWHTLEVSFRYSETKPENTRTFSLNNNNNVLYLYNYCKLYLYNYCKNKSNIRFVNYNCSSPGKMTYAYLLLELHTYINLRKGLKRLLPSLSNICQYWRDSYGSYLPFAVLCMGGIRGSKAAKFIFLVLIENGLPDWNLLLILCIYNHLKFIFI